jgi:diguanylate cyclase (GGDEF)-like protein
MPRWKLRLAPPRPEDIPDELSGSPVFLSTLTAGSRDLRLATLTVAISLLFFIALVPFAKIPQVRIWAFIPIYEAALVVNDLITAVLLFGQFNILRTRALFVLACGYLFTAFLAVAHALTFPGLFSDSGLLGAGNQTTVWLYMFWHGGFPLFVISYARQKDQDDAATLSGPAASAIALGAVAVFALTAALVALVTQGHSLLPVLLLKGHYTLTMNVVVTSVWGLSLLAILELWRKRRHSVLDLWLMVVLCAWVADIGLSAVFNGARFDLGFYMGRIYGLLAASFVLVVLLLENGLLYARLVDASAELHRLSVQDPLTGVANRRAFSDALEREWNQAIRHHRELSLLMMDVDFFKKYNDTYGHVAGDQCLRSVAEVLALAAKRAGDVVSRYGGEEFAILLPNMDHESATGLARRLCQAVSELGIPHQGSQVAEHVTLSIGVASVRYVQKAGESHPVGPQQFINAADQALYSAKHQGRNQVVASLFDVPPFTH